MGSELALALSRRLSAGFRPHSKNLALAPTENKGPRVSLSLVPAVMIGINIRHWYLVNDGAARRDRLFRPRADGWATMMRRITPLFAAVFSLALLGGAAAGPLEDGQAAYRHGDYATAMRLLRPLADQGDASAQFGLGLMYVTGRGVPQDDAQGAAWYRKAAEQGDATAQLDLGSMYFKGQGVPQDYAQAVAWYRKAAQQGDAWAQNNLGMMYDEGRGVPQDYAQAVVWYRRAAEQGDADAQVSLGYMYAKGRGLPKNDAQAIVWFRKAAEQGLAAGQFDLGVHYFDGEGVPQDYVLAHMWFNLAASGAKTDEARERFVKLRGEVAAKMTSAQIAEAQRMAREWKPK